MITAFRRHLESWVVRGFFLIMVGAFILWGVGDVIRVVGTSTWVAKTDATTIESPAFQAEFQRGMSQATRDLPPGQEPTPALRRSVGNETLQRMVGEASLTHAMQQMRIIVPDPAVRQAVFENPAFHGSDGRFSRAVLEARLRNNGLTEQHYLDLVRANLAQRQVLQSLAAGAYAPQAEAEPIYAAEFEKRSADIAEFPLAAAPAPPAPTEAQLKRWYDNHPDSYIAPEYRRIRAIELSPRTLAAEIPITEADLRDAYERYKSSYVTSEKRSVQVISIHDEKQAAVLAAQWQGGASWETMQAAAQRDGGSAIALDDLTQREFPDPALANAAFTASADTVSNPVKTALGWHVVKVTHIIPGVEKSFAQVKDELRNKVLAEKGADLMYERANKVDNLLGNGTSLHDLPGNLGLAGVAGTLDANGNTPDGGPAPIPGAPELRAAIITAAFKAQKGEPPQLTEVQTPSTGGSAYYALSVEDITPPAVKPFDTVKDKVTRDWTDHQRRHTQEEAAAKMLTALKNGQSFQDAATVAGVATRQSVLVTRTMTDQSLPPELQRVLFTLKPHEPTMVETPDAFLVAVPAQIVAPDPKSDPAGYGQIRESLNRSIGGDIQTVFADTLRERANLRINRKNFDSIVQP
jgi:peptidyl-prolyl cis-trans isomerase D